MNRCCVEKSKWEIIFDVGINNSTWLVCDIHYREDLFQKSIKAIKKVES